MTNDAITNRCRQIAWILSDVDGVMTDGGVIISDGGEQTIRFHIHDGLGVRIWRSSGGRFGILTGRKTQALRIRAEMLEVDAFYEGADDKLSAFERFLAEHGALADHVCYIGDDLLDMPVLRRAGIAIAVPNAPTEIRELAHYVTKRGGGDGAVRDAVEFLLKSADGWERALSPYNQ